MDGDLEENLEYLGRNLVDYLVHFVRHLVVVDRPNVDFGHVYMRLYPSNGHGNLFSADLHADVTSKQMKLGVNAQLLSTEDAEATSEILDKLLHYFPSGDFRDIRLTVSGAKILTKEAIAFAEGMYDVEFLGGIEVRKRLAGERDYALSPKNTTEYQSDVFRQLETTRLQLIPTNNYCRLVAKVEGPMGLYTILLDVPDTNLGERDPNNPFDMALDSPRYIVLSPFGNNISAGDGADREEDQFLTSVANDVERLLFEVLSYNELTTYSTHNGLLQHRANGYEQTGKFVYMVDINRPELLERLYFGESVPKTVSPELIKKMIVN